MQDRGYLHEVGVDLQDICNQFCSSGVVSVSHPESGFGGSCCKVTHNGLSEVHLYRAQGASS